MAIWFSQDPRSGEWMRYAPDDCRLLEKSFQTNQKPVELDFAGAKFIVDLKKMTQSNSGGGSRKVKREAGSTGTGGSDCAKFVNGLFAEADSVDVNGFQNFFDKLKVDLTTADSYVFVYLVKPKENWKFFRVEVQDFFSANSIIDPASLAKLMKTTKADLQQDKTAFAKFVDTAFCFSRNTPTSNVIPFDEAVQYIPQLEAAGGKLITKHPKLLEFMGSKLRSMARDQWQQYFKFLVNVNASLSNFNPDECWSTVIEDYVESVQKK